MKVLIFIAIFYGYAEMVFAVSSKVKYCQSKTIETCPPTAADQGKKIPLAAVFYNKAFWQEQIPPTISCNYGLKKDGSYKVYLQYICCMPSKKGEWEPMKREVEQYQCLSQNPKDCPFTMSTDPGC